MESIDDALNKRFGKSLVYLMKLIDPDPLVEQRRLYLYLLYRKWRGEGFYGSPYEIVSNCHPYPTNWNGKPLINRLMKENKMVRAKYQGDFGIYTLDEAKVWNMTDITPFNF